MVGIQNPGPLCPAALGTALVYYGLGILRPGEYPPVPLISGVILTILGLIGLCRLPASLPELFYPAASDRIRRNCRIAILCLGALGFGCTLGLAARAALRDAPAFGLPAGKILGIRGVLLEDPRGLRGGQGMARLVQEETAGRDGLRASARGKITVFFPRGTIPRLRTFGRGSRIFVDGVLGDGAGGAGGELFFRARSVHIIKGPSPLDQLRTDIRLFLLDRLSPDSIRSSGAAGRDDWGGLALALLLGIRDNLDNELAAAYRDAGCSHVLALSGMHLGIVSAVIAFLLRKPLGLRAAAVPGTLFVLLYVYLAGVQPSLERSAIMYILGTLVLMGSFPRNPLSLLSLTFLIQIILRPESGNSISFILSYLALWGLLVPGEGLYGLFRGRIPDLLSRPLSASLGAFIATAAVSAAFFGVLRPVGILAGILIVPLTTVFMIGSMIWLALNCLLPLLAIPAGLVLSFLYGILFRLVQVAGRVPGIGTADPQVVLVLSAAGVLMLAGIVRIKMRSDLAPFG
ncbi:MAG: ComEC/Rec2 family competence protein [Spirochaetaceae bacterium]|jgi:competence protein ComEC|nr:ComEC/Rec2 family competence protein [Spirochaetaceae bacterium]